MRWARILALVIGIVGSVLAVVVTVFAGLALGSSRWPASLYGVVLCGPFSLIAPLLWLGSSRELAVVSWSSAELSV